MKTQITEGFIKIDIGSLVKSMSLEDKSIFIEDVVFEEKIIQMFSDFISSDYAFDSSKWMSCYSTAKPIRRIADTVRAQYLKAHSEVYNKQISQYEKDLEDLAKRQAETQDKLWKLEREISAAAYSAEPLKVGNSFYILNKIEESK